MRTDRWNGAWGVGLALVASVACVAPTAPGASPERAGGKGDFDQPFRVHITASVGDENLGCPSADGPFPSAFRELNSIEGGEEGLKEVLADPGTWIELGRFGTERPVRAWLNVFGRPNKTAINTITRLLTREYPRQRDVEREFRAVIREGGQWLVNHSDAIALVAMTLVARRLWPLEGVSTAAQRGLAIASSLLWVNDLYRGQAGEKDGAPSLVEDFAQRVMAMGQLGTSANGRDREIWLSRAFPANGPLTWDLPWESDLGALVPLALFGRAPEGSRAGGFSLLPFGLSRPKPSLLHLRLGGSLANEAATKDAEALGQISAAITSATEGRDVLLLPVNGLVLPTHGPKNQAYVHGGPNLQTLVRPPSSRYEPSGWHHVGPGGVGALFAPAGARRGASIDVVLGSSEAHPRLPGRGSAHGAIHHWFGLGDADRAPPPFEAGAGDLKIVCAGSTRVHAGNVDDVVTGLSELKAWRENAEQAIATSAASISSDPTAIEQLWERTPTHARTITLHIPEDRVSDIDLPEAIEVLLGELGYDKAAVGAIRRKQHAPQSWDARTFAVAMGFLREEQQGIVMRPDRFLIDAKATYVISLTARLDGDTPWFVQGQAAGGANAVVLPEPYAVVTGQLQTGLLRLMGSLYTGPSTKIGAAGTRGATAYFNRPGQPAVVKEGEYAQVPLWSSLLGTPASD